MQTRINKKRKRTVTQERPSYLESSENYSGESSDSSSMSESPIKKKIPAKRVKVYNNVTLAAEETKEINLNKLNISPSTRVLAKEKMHRVILWLRNDLRLHDNPVFHWAAT
jgi:hypothetical protein